MYRRSMVSTDYCHLTEEGEKAVVQWINMMGPQMHKLQEEEMNAHAKKLVWDELKK